MDDVKNDKTEMQPEPEPKSVFESRLEEAEGMVSEEVRDFVFPLLRDLWEENNRQKERIDGLFREEEGEEEEAEGEEGEEEEEGDEEGEDSEGNGLSPRIVEAIGFTENVLVNTASSLALLGRNLKNSTDENHKKNAPLFEKGVKESIGDISLLYVAWKELSGMSTEDAKTAWKTAFRAKLEELHR